jgi:Ni/Fe-hydrogenase subunit HybB-like protein
MTGEVKTKKSAPLVFEGTSVIWWIWVAILCAFVLVGFYGIYLITQYPEIPTVPWGVLVSVYVFFALAATGSSIINSIQTVFGFEKMKPMLKRGIWISLITIVPAWIYIIVDLGRYFSFYNLYLLFHSTSRMAWMGLLYIFFGSFLFIELISHIREKSTPRWFMSLMGILVIIVTLGVHTNLGALFGAAWSNPLWNGVPYLPFYFLVSAVLAGAALQITFTSITYLVKKRELPEIFKEIFINYYSIIIIGLIIVNFLFMAGKDIAGRGSPFIGILTTGPYSVMYWGIEVLLGGLIPLALLIHPGTRRSINGLLAASILVLLGAAVSKYDLIIAGQSIKLSVYAWTTQYISYLPSAAEIATLIGGIAFWLLLYTIGDLLLPLEQEEEPKRWYFFK